MARDRAERDRRQRNEEATESDALDDQDAHDIVR